MGMSTDNAALGNTSTSRGHALRMLLILLLLAAKHGDGARLVQETPVSLLSALPKGLAGLTSSGRGFKEGVPTAKGEKGEAATGALRRSRRAGKPSFAGNGPNVVEQPGMERNEEWLTRRALTLRRELHRLSSPACKPWTNCAGYDPTVHVCLDGLLCPVGYKRCSSTSCYTSDKYTCQNHTLIPRVAGSTQEDDNTAVGMCQTGPASAPSGQPTMAVHTSHLSCVAPNINPCYNANGKLGICCPHGGCHPKNARCNKPPKCLVSGDQTTTAAARTNAPATTSTGPPTPTDTANTTITAGPASLTSTASPTSASNVRTSTSSRGTSNGTRTHATFTIKNSCSFDIRPALIPISNQPVLSTGGFLLPAGAQQVLQAPLTWGGRFWARTDCKFTGGVGKCEIGDCNGKLDCGTMAGQPPYNVAEVVLKAYSGLDFYDVSLVDGYNVPISLVPSGSYVKGPNPTLYTCGSPHCTLDMSSASCAPVLRVSDPSGTIVGCESACYHFKESRYCCDGWSQYNTPVKCPPFDYSKLFKAACPTAYSYAYDDTTSTYTCTDADYVITFC